MVFWPEIASREVSPRFHYTSKWEVNVYVFYKRDCPLKALQSTTATSISKYQSAPKHFTSDSESDFYVRTSSHVLLAVYVVILASGFKPDASPKVVLPSKTLIHP